jgi:hypothetical protein
MKLLFFQFLSATESVLLGSLFWSTLKVGEEILLPRIKKKQETITHLSLVTFVRVWWWGQLAPLERRKTFTSPQEAKILADS